MPRVRYLTLWIAAAIIIVFALQHILPLRWAWQVGSVEWQFFGSMLAHGSTSHLLGNLFALGVFGLVLEGRIGSSRLGTVLLSAGILGNLAGIGSYNSVLGISGAVYGIIGALAILRPFLVIWVSAIPAPMFLVAAGWTFFDIVGSFADTGTGHLAHLAGLAAGIILGLAWRSEYGDKPRRRSKNRGNKGRDEMIDARLDAFEQRHMT